MTKYRPYPAVQIANRTWPDKTIDRPPQWCSVDLRDGNQALATPMNGHQKLRMFDLLCSIGFKEIEVGFPAASQIDFDFARSLIDEGRIPDGVAIQVLTQARQHLIARTVDSLKGSKQAILHLYNSTSEQQRRITFKMTKAQIKDLAVQGTKMVIDEIARISDTDVTLEYSPESFTGTELDYAVEVCDAVINTWDPVKRGKIIINLPATVEMSTPNIYADMIEQFGRQVAQRDQVILSLHTHNDRGTGVAATEFGLMAGADRVEGTLFGNGERTGNLDIVTVALNMFSQGVDSGLDFSDIPKVRKIFEETTGMEVPPRWPYGGDLVFTAFSGSHQDAISKGMAMVKKDQLWDVPYLPIDPKDIGRSYEAIIRINSQSGKGGVAFILEREYGIRIPRAMQPELGALVNTVSDQTVKELNPQEILEIFVANYIEKKAPLALDSYRTEHKRSGEVSFSGTITVGDDQVTLEGKGNGPISAFLQGINSHFGLNFSVEVFEEQALGVGTGTEAAAYVGLANEHNVLYWGAGRDADSGAAQFEAILSALNRCGCIEST